MTDTGEPFDAWNYRPQAGHVSGTDLTGYRVMAADGRAGAVLAAYDDADSAALVMRTRRVLGRELALPAGVVQGFDHDSRTVYVDRSKRELLGAPQFDRNAGLDESGRDRLAGYYAAFYPATR
jgi:hypothetical protein